METFATSYITRGNPYSFSDESLCNIQHQNNRIFFETYKSEIVYHKNPNLSSFTLQPPPEIIIYFALDHRIVPDDLPLIFFGSGECRYGIYRSFSQPLTVFGSDTQARPAFRDMISRLGAPFEFRAEYGELHWGCGMYGERNDPIQGFDDAIARISKACVTMVRNVLTEATHPASVKSFELRVHIIKRTVIEADRFRVMEALLEEWQRPRTQQDQDRNRVLGAVETMRYNDEDDVSECSICLTEVVIGTQVAKLPCPHKFHPNCIATWLEKRPTCPLCRFNLLDLKQNSDSCKSLH